MFLGEATCLVFYAIIFLTGHAKPSEEEKDLTHKQRALRLVKFLPLFVLLAFCDLLGTTLAGIGLLYIPSSVYQLFRGSIIIFTSIWSKFLLKNKFPLYKLIGLVLVCKLLHPINFTPILGCSRFSSRWRLWYAQCI